MGPKKDLKLNEKPERRRTVSFGGTTIVQDNEGQDESSEPFHKHSADSRRISGAYSENIPEGDEYDSSSMVDIPAELPPPPDGGWGWVVVFASFLANMVVDGTAYSFSPFLNEFSVYFDEPKGKVAWISSLLAGVYLSAGPIASALTNKFGCRLVCISGSIIASLAYASTVFANSVAYLMVTQGLIAGFGFGLIYLPAVVCVGYYFESKRALATGIAVCGSGVGTMIFPPLINVLIENFGWQGANLIIAGFILNCCWMGALMRPLEVPKMKKKDLLHRLAEEKKIAMELGSLYGSNYLTVTNSDGTVEKKIKPGKILNADPGVHSNLNLSGYLTPVGTSLALPTIQEGVQPPPNSSNTSPLAKEVLKKNLPPVAAPIEDEKDSLVEKSPTKGKPVLKLITKIQRNNSQPTMEKNGSSVPKILSVPNFERRLSKMDLVNQLKVVPATNESSYTNLRLLGSQDRRASQGYGRVGSFADSEAAGVLRLRRPSKEKKGVVLNPLSRQDIFYTGSIRHLQEFKSQSSMLSYRESTFNLQSSTAASRAVLEALEDFEDEDEVDSIKPGKCSGFQDFCNHFKEMMDFSLLKNPVFLLIGFANMIGMLGFYTPFVYLPAAAMEKGISQSHATLLVSIIGVTNTVGRVLSGLLADLPQVNALWVNNLSIIFSGLCVFLVPFAYSLGAFITIAIFFGFFVSAYISLTSIILVELLGLGSLTNAFGLLILFRGSASMVGPPLAGSIYDATQSYDVSFWFAGILLFICSGLHCIIPLVQRCSPRLQGPVHYRPNTEYLKSNPGDDNDPCNGGGHSPDAGEGVGIMFEIKPKKQAAEAVPPPIEIVRENVSQRNSVISMKEIPEDAVAT